MRTRRFLGASQKKRSLRTSVTKVPRTVVSDTPSSIVSLEHILSIETIKDNLTEGRVYNVDAIKQVNSSPSAVSVIRTRRGRIVRRVYPNRRQRRELSGPEHLNLTGDNIYTGPRILEWPEEMDRIFVISMRPKRWQGLQARMGKWATKMVMFNATNGHQLSKQDWINRGIVVKGSNLSRGQIGCYDSHVRIWKHIIRNNILSALILEDDANIRYTQGMEEQLKEFFGQLKTNNVQYDMIFIGRGNHNKFKTILPGVVRPKTCQGLFAYVLTLSGAQKLLEKSYPYKLPVDVLAERLCDSGEITAVAMEPRLCHVVPVISDTAGIL